MFEEFMTFRGSPLNDGTERWMGNDDTSLVEVIGPAGAPFKVTMIFTTDDASVAAVNVLLFMAATAPDAAEAGLNWVSNNLESVRALAGRLATTIEGIRFSLDSAESLIPGGLLLSAESGG